MTTIQSKTSNLPGLADNFLECRSYYSHALSRVGFFYWKSDMGRGICKVSKCSRCKTYREDYFYSDGRKLRTHYHYPDGYIIEGSGRLILREVRKEMLRRVDVIHASPDDLPVPARVKRKTATRVSKNPKKNPVKRVDSAVR